MGQTKCFICEEPLPEWDEPEIWHYYTTPHAGEVAAHDACVRSMPELSFVIVPDEEAS